MRQSALGIFLACTLCACAHDKGVATTPAAAAQTNISAAAKDAPAAPVVESKRAAKPVIHGVRAMEYVKDVVAFGPRYLGSPGHQKLEDYLRMHLLAYKPDNETEESTFILDRPEGKFEVRNFIAKFPGKKDGIIVIAGHYDTNYPLRNTKYVGANDGGSSTAILLELANQLQGPKRDGYSVWLVWLDAEEAMQQWSETDSLYGSRHLAEAWEKDGTLKKVKAFLLADMIGDSDLNIDRDANSTEWLENLVLEAATRLGVQSHFYGREIGVEDDHMPFVKRGVPSADLIDMDYGYNDVFHHTPQDTVDKLSPRSLEIAGDVIYETVQLIDERK